MAKTSGLLSTAAAIAALVALAGCSGGDTPPAGTATGASTQPTPSVMTAPAPTQDAAAEWHSFKGTVVTPPNVWLDDRYAGGFETIEIGARPLTLSPDRSVMMVEVENPGEHEYVAGLDTLTGAEKWRSGTELYLQDAADDYALFTGEVPDSLMDAATGASHALSGVPEITGYAALLGVRDDVAYLQYFNDTHIVLAAKTDGSAVWVHDLAVPEASCVLADDHIGCWSGGAVTVFDLTGAIVGESSVPGVIWANDGDIDQVTSTAHDWTGAARGAAAEIGVWPRWTEDSYWSIDDHVTWATYGPVMAAAARSDGSLSAVLGSDFSSITFLPSGATYPEDARVLSANAAGDVFALFDDATALALVDGDGKVVAEAEVDSSLTAVDGILFDMPSGYADSTRYYAPKG